MPVIMAGIRTSAVWVIGTATLSTPIGQTSLGNYIFAGLQTQNWVFVMFGCIAAAVLALVVDQMLALMERGRRRAQPLRDRRWRASAWCSSYSAALLPGHGAARKATYVIGAKPFTEQYVLAALIEQRLEAATASRRSAAPASAPACIFNALAAGDIDAYVDYSGTIWANEMHRSDVKPRARSAGRTCRAGSTRHTASACSARSASRTPMRWRCRARAPRRSASARSPISPRMRANSRSPAITNSSSAPNGRRSATPTACISASSARCSRISCTKAAAAGDVDVGVGLHQRRPDRAIRSRRARRSEARHPAL